jgi:hypothetical protein
VISEQVWRDRERLGRDPAVLGRPLTLNGAQFTIVGAKVAPLAQLIDAAVENRRYQAGLFTAFGAAALLIAIVGVSATTPYGVSRRRRELNIRVALGAQASQVTFRGGASARRSIRPCGSSPRRPVRWV